jgi:3-deoxy-7-phosphoheptulonate synthase
MSIVANNEVLIIAGPCAIESRDQLFRISKLVKENGVSYLRAGAYKPRTSPYSFQGLEREGLRFLKQAGEEFGLKTVTEVTDADLIEAVADHADILQIGTRNMANYALLKKVGQLTARTHQPVLLKRGFSSTIEEWLLAAEYIIQAGNPDVILCERGIRTFESATRFTLDLSAIQIIKKLSKLPIIVDPSHGTGHADMVIPMSKAAIACGADGIILEVHDQPKEALCDGKQSLDEEEFKVFMEQIRKIAQVEGKTVV